MGNKLLGCRCGMHGDAFRSFEAENYIPITIRLQSDEHFGPEGLKMTPKKIKYRQLCFAVDRLIRGMDRSLQDVLHVLRSHEAELRNLGVSHAAILAPWLAAKLEETATLMFW